MTPESYTRSNSGHALSLPALGSCTETGLASLLGAVSGSGEPSNTVLILVFTPDRREPKSPSQIGRLHRVKEKTASVEQCMGQQFWWDESNTAAQGALQAVPRLAGGCGREWVATLCSINN